MFKGTPTGLYSQYSIEENVKAVSKQLYLVASECNLPEFVDINSSCLVWYSMSKSSEISMAKYVRRPQSKVVDRVLQCFPGYIYVTVVQLLIEVSNQSSANSWKPTVF